MSAQKPFTIVGPDGTTYVAYPQQGGGKSQTKGKKQLKKERQRQKEEGKSGGLKFYFFELPVAILTILLLTAAGIALAFLILGIGWETMNEWFGDVQWISLR